jgi:putative ABC transport system ATP-binding protein
MNGIPPGQPLLVAEGLVRWRGDKAVIVGASLSLVLGESVALVGPSGCGKTTLLHLLGVLDRPTAGTVVIEGVDPWRTGRNARAALRLRRLGFVFQQSNLMPFLSARDNVALPAWRLHGSRRMALAQADLLLDKFGLGTRANAAGGVLSLGEAQRVATARAMINRPAIILADEPTGSLDSAATEAVLDSFDDVVREGTTLLVATHDPRVADRMHRILHMEDGALVTHPAAAGSSWIQAGTVT